MHALANEPRLTRKPRLRRVGGFQPRRLTGSQREVLELLYEYGFLTTRLLALAYGARAGRDGRGYWHLQRELRRLFDAGLVQRFAGAATTATAGSTECVYTITHLGARAVLDDIEYAAARHDIYNRQSKQRGNLEHHVAIATLQIILTLGQRGWSLAEFRAEERNPRACARVKVRDRVLVAWPDAMALIDTGHPVRRLKYLFELDLSRKSNPRVEDRFRAYAAYLVERRRKPMTGEPRTEPTVVFAVAGESELERFLVAAGQVLSAWAEPDRPCFLFWNMEDWYAGDGVGVSRAGRPIGTGAVLRPPREILAESVLTTIDGQSRLLVEEGIDGRPA